MAKRARDDHDEAHDNTARAVNSEASRKQQCLSPTRLSHQEPSQERQAATAEPHKGGCYVRVSCQTHICLWHNCGFECYTSQSRLRSLNHCYSNSECSLCHPANHVSGNPSFVV